MANQIARSRLIIRENEERLKRPRSMHHAFAIDEVELHPGNWYFTRYPQTGRRPATAPYYNQTDPLPEAPFGPIKGLGNC
jgi:hypothetical protein